MTHQRNRLSRQDITPAGVESWCVWNGASAGWKNGVGVPPSPSLHLTSAQRPILRYVDTDGGGQDVLAEILLDSPSEGCWELWRVGIDEDARQSGYEESLAWCHWPNGSIEDAAKFLLGVQREAFQQSKTDTELAATKIIKEFIAGTADLLMSNDEDEGD